MYIVSDSMQIYRRERCKDLGIVQLAAFDRRVVVELFSMYK